MIFFTILYADIAEIQKKGKALEEEINLLTKDADTLAEEAEAQKKMHLLTKSNALRKAANDKKELLTKMKNEISAKRQRLC